MKAVIDASNIRAGGGLVHLEEFLRAAEPEAHGFEQIDVWSGTTTLDRLPDRRWLKKSLDPLLNGNLQARVYWQWARLKRECEGADVLFVPGGTHPGNVRPLVTMIQNWLPFDQIEIARYGFSRESLRLRLLRNAQVSTLRKADAVIYLSEFAKNGINEQVPGLTLRSAIVPHGVAEDFRALPRKQRDFSEFTHTYPVRMLYVSTVDYYKQQLNLVKAVALLRAKGLPVTLDLVGSGKEGPLRDLKALIAQHDSGGQFLHYLGPIAYAKVRTLYSNADLFLFPSSCETFGMPVLEAMAHSVPVLSSNRTVMPEIVGTGGDFFDPEKPEEIAATIERYTRDTDLRARLAEAGYKRAAQFSWKEAAEDTMQVLHDVTVAKTKLHAQPTSV